MMAINLRYLCSARLADARDDSDRAMYFLPIGQ
jgi:hypothetical protein